MKNLRKLFAIFAFVIGGISNANAGIPVIDAANLANSVQQVLAWGQQYQQMVSQLNQMKSQFDSMNGTRGIANLLKNPSLYEFMPRDFASVLAADGSGGSGAGATMATLKLYGIEQTSLNPNSATGKLFQNNQNQNAVFRMLGEQGYKAMGDRLTQLNALTQSIDGATDPKAIADLQARISAEQAFLQNEQAKLQILAQMQAGQERIRQQQGREILMKSSTGNAARF
jgi:type IV secretion system protein VirB5